MAGGVLKKGLDYDTYSKCLCYSLQTTCCHQCDPPERNSGEICHGRGRQTRLTFGDFVRRRSSLNFKRSGRKRFYKESLLAFQEGRNKKIDSKTLGLTGSKFDTFISATDRHPS